MPRQKISLLSLAILASASITAHRFMTPGGATTGLAGDAIGVSNHSGSSGDYIDTDVIGTTIIETGAAFAVNSYLQSDATGRAIAATAPATKQATIAGGAAGDLTVTGIATTDRLVSVVRLNRDGTAANIDISALTAEFTITAANTINNAGGTVTTGDTLLVTYESTRPVKARALQASGGAGEFVEALLILG